MRYNFYELRKIPQKDQLPKDVNEHPESVAKEFGSDNLIVQMIHHREKRLYGTVMHVDKKTKVVDGQFIFQDGMCIRFKLIKYPNEDIITERSVHNKNLSLSKGRYSDKPESDATTEE